MIDSIHTHTYTYHTRREKKSYVFFTLNETAVIFNREENRRGEIGSISSFLKTNSHLERWRQQPRRLATRMHHPGRRGGEREGRERSNADTVSPSLLPLFASASKPSFTSVSAHRVSR